MAAADEPVRLPDAAAKPSCAGKASAAPAVTWNTLVETVVRAPQGRVAGAAPARAIGGAAPVAARRHRRGRRPAPADGIGELDRVLGGGIVPGSLILRRRRAGDRQVDAPAPGGGRARRRASSTPPARSRPPRSACAPARLGPARRGGRRAAIEVLAEHDVGRIVEVARSMRPALVVVDSIQTATVDELDGAAGSVGQVRESTVRLMEFAKGEGIAVVLVGHVTKDGSIAGPEDARAPRRRGHRASRASATPRCGSSAPRRTASGRPMRSACSRWPASGLRRGRRSGACVPRRPRRARRRAASSRRRWRAAGRCSSRSRRSSSPAGYGTPARKASGIDPNRLGLLVAVLGRRAGVGLGSPRRLREPRRRPERRRARPRPAGRPGPRLVAARSARGRPAPSRSARSACSASCASVAGLERRLREAARLGFEHGDRAAARARWRPRSTCPGSAIIEAATLRDAIEVGARRAARDLVATPCPRC